MLPSLGTGPASSPSSSPGCWGSRERKRIGSLDYSPAEAAADRRRGPGAPLWRRIFGGSRVRARHRGQARRARHPVHHRHRDRRRGVACPSVRHRPVQCCDRRRRRPRHDDGRHDASRRSPDAASQADLGEPRAHARRHGAAGARPDAAALHLHGRHGARARHQLPEAAQPGRRDRRARAQHRRRRLDGARRRRAGRRAERHRHGRRRWPTGSSRSCRRRWASSSR